MVKLSKSPLKGATKKKAKTVKLSKTVKKKVADSDSEQVMETAECETDGEVADVTESPVKCGKRKAEQTNSLPGKRTKSEDGEHMLFVGNISRKNTFEEIKLALRELFVDNNLEAQSIHIGSSRTFAYVEFATEKELEKALELQGNKVLDQTVRLEKAKAKQKPKNKRGSDLCTLFVGNVPLSASQPQLKEVFPEAVNIRIPTDESGAKGIAFVEFESEAVADKVLEEKRRTMIDGQVVVLEYTGEKKSAPRDAEEAGRTLMVSNLAFSISTKHLKDLFKYATAIRGLEREGRRKGRALVDFKSTEQANEAMESLHNLEIHGRAIRLEFYHKPDNRTGSSGPSKTLFVKGLSKEITEDMLKDSFDGAVAARVVRDKRTGSAKGYGFVDFASEQECQEARKTMADCEIDGEKVFLEFARCPVVTKSL